MGNYIKICRKMVYVENKAVKKFFVLYERLKYL